MYKYHEDMDNLHMDLLIVHIVYRYIMEDKDRYKSDPYLYKNLDMFHHLNKVN